MINTRNMQAAPRQPGPAKKQQLSNPQWGASTAKVGEEVKLKVSSTDLHENANVIFSIWKEGFDPAVDIPVAKVYGPNKGNAAEAKWSYSVESSPEVKTDASLLEHYDSLGIERNPEMIKHHITDHTAAFENDLDDTAKFVFTAIGFKCQEIESGTVEIGDEINTEIFSLSDSEYANIDYEIIEVNGSKKSGTIGSDSPVDEKSMIPGLYQMKITRK